MRINGFVLAVALSTAASAMGLDPAPGQEVYVDSRQKPPVDEVPRIAPRSFDSPELFGAGNRVIAPPLDLPRLLEEDAEAGWGPLRIGVVQEFEQPAEGLWSSAEDGGRLWTLAVEAPGAKAIRLRIAPWDTPPGAELILYNPASLRTALGPIRALSRATRDTLWTPYIYGDVAHVEYYLPPWADREEQASPITIDALLNRYRLGFEEMVDRGDRELDCHLDVSCYPQWQNEANGVGGISSLTNQFAFFCSGAMYNRVAGDFTPLFALARHCGVTPNNVQAKLVEWFYQTPSCNGDPPDIETFPQTPAEAALVIDANTDYLLLGLSSENTSGVTFVGWTNAYWDSGGASVGIHHPGGSYKRITFGTKTIDTDFCEEAGYPLSWLIENADGDGEIEPGSSGSPIFDSEQRARGVASCANWGCDSDNIASYGRLDEAYPLLEPFLNPTDPIYVDASYEGEEHGTEAQPFDTVHEGAYAVIRGSDVFIEAGTYDGWLRIDREMTLHARNGVVTIGH